jgi:hypothetical protein
MRNQSDEHPARASRSAGSTGRRDEFPVDLRKGFLSCGSLSVKKTNQPSLADTYIPVLVRAWPVHGVLHLPALAESFAGSHGKLASGCPGIGKGYDIDHQYLGLNADAVKKFIETKPTTHRFEGWVRKQPGVKLDEATLKHNSAIAVIS